MEQLFIKNSQGILLDLADFAIQEQPEDNFNQGCHFSSKNKTSLVINTRHVNNNTSLPFLLLLNYFN